MSAEAAPPDIFVSYKKEDAERVRLLVEALELQGWSVWWDPEIRTGDEWSPAIERAIRSAGCIVVCWSEQSVGSSWVEREAHFGDNKGILAPVMLDKVAPPFAFAHIQGANLVGWIGNPRAPQFLDLVRHVQGILGKEAVAQDESKGRLVRRIVRYRAHLVAAAVALLSLGGVGAYLAVPVDRATEVELQDVVAEQVRLSIGAPNLSQSTGGQVSSVDATRRFRVQEVTAAGGLGGEVELYVPSSTMDGQSVPPSTNQAEIVLVGPPSEGGTLEIDAFEVPVGARIQVEGIEGGDPARYVLHVDSVPEGRPLRLELHARGPVAVYVPDGPDAVLDFGDPGRDLRLDTQTDRLSLELTLPKGVDPVHLIEDLAVSQIELSAVEENVELEAGSRAVRRSTVESGTLQIVGRPHDLGPAETVRFGAFEGLVGSLDFSRGQLLLNATGERVTDIEAGSENEYTSLMPSRWRALRDPWPALLWVAAALWVALLFLLIPRFWRAPR